MTLILNIETATKNCSVSLAENGTTIAIKELNNGNYSHAEKLHVFIEDVLKMANKTMQEIDAIAVSKGPGSFTGLRIGVSAAKGLCFSLDIPLISIDTLQSFALQMNHKKGLVVPMLDARRMEVYAAVFDTNNEQVREILAEILTENSFEAYLDKGPVYFVGDGIDKSKEIITHKNAIYMSDNKYPSANEMAQLSFDKFKHNYTEDVAYFEPFYLKDFLITVSKKK